MKNDRLERGALSLEEIRAKLQLAIEEHGTLCSDLKISYEFEKSRLREFIAAYCRLIGYWQWRERTYFDRYHKTTL